MPHSCETYEKWRELFIGEVARLSKGKLSKEDSEAMADEVGQWPFENGTDPTESAKEELSLAGEPDEFEDA